jgi:iron-regulated transporter 1
MEKKVKVSSVSKTSFIINMITGWKTFFKDPIAIMALSFAFLWLSVLSPHGVLLTGFLKDGWNFPEWGIGIFRGLGGLFGLLATFLFPIMCKKVGVEEGSRFFLGFQLITVFLALICFTQDQIAFQIGFMFFILLSRVGLYGFGLGEVQIRQLKIGEKVRGEFNGFATALTGVATIILYGLGTLLRSTNHFKFLVIGSFSSVLISFLLYSYWIRVSGKAPKV